MSRRFMSRHTIARNLVSAVAASVIAMIAFGAVTDAEAKCTRLGFSVNDYGKDGPTKDAKSLLDKYVAKWAVDNGVKNYTIGKKTVTCELFLDFGVFDEHTCRAEAPVCWGGSGGPVTAPAAGAAPATKPTPASPTPAAVPAPKA
jgi:hypothetical protein